MNTPARKLRSALLSALALSLLFVAWGCSEQGEPTQNPVSVAMDDQVLLIEDPVEALLESEDGGAPVEARHRIARLAELLGLDEAQIEALTIAYSTFRDEIYSIRTDFRDGAISRDEAMTLVAAARDAFEAEIQLILTPEQYALLQELRENRDGQSRHRGDMTERWEALLAEIGADTDQSMAVLAAVETLMEGMADLRAQIMEGELTREEAAALAAALRESFLAELREILTPEQMEALLELLPDRSRRRR